MKRNKIKKKKISTWVAHSLHKSSPGARISQSNFDRILSSKRNLVSEKNLSYLHILERENYVLFLQKDKLLCLHYKWKVLK